MATEKPKDQVAIILDHADDMLEDWFKKSRVTTGQAAVLFAGFLKRAAVGLEGMSERLGAQEPGPRPVRRRTASSRAVTRRPARVKTARRRKTA